MSKTNRKSKPEIVLPPIRVMEDEARRLTPSPVRPRCFSRA